MFFEQVFKFRLNISFQFSPLFPRVPIFSCLRPRLHPRYSRMSVYVRAMLLWLKNLIGILKCIFQMVHKIAFLWIFMVTRRRRMHRVKISHYYRTVIKLRFNFEFGNVPQFWCNWSYFILCSPAPYQVSIYTTVAEQGYVCYNEFYTVQWSYSECSNSNC